VSEPSFIEITRNHLKWALWASIGSTVLFVIASLNPALNNLEQWAFVILNTTRFIMLGCFIVLVVGLVSYRMSTPPSLSFVGENGKLHVSPCDLQNVWVIDDLSLRLSPAEALQKAPTKDHRKIQIVIVRSNDVPDSFTKILFQLKNLIVLDVQRSVIPHHFWTELESCRNLHHILAHGTLVDSDMKGIHMTLPEAKFYLDPCQIVIRHDKDEDTRKV
jgi:hypothetical protein